MSKIYLEGKNYPGGDEGQFYIHNDPLIRVNFGCYKKTQLSSSVFPLIPIPSFSEIEPHDSMANQHFSMELRYEKSPEVTPATLEARVALQNGEQILILAESEKVLSIFPMYRYKYISELKCGDIRNGTLYIKLNERTDRTYRIEFKEDVKRQVKYHLELTT